MRKDLQKWIRLFQEVNHDKITVKEEDGWQSNLMRDIRKLKNENRSYGFFSKVDMDLNSFLWKWALLCVFFAAFFFLYGTIAGGSMYGYLYSSLFVDPYSNLLAI